MKDLIEEEVFIKPTLIEDLGRLFTSKNNKWKARYGIYKCPFCGTHFKVQTTNIKSGHTKSCGCYQKSQSAKSSKLLCTTHGEVKTRLYRIWLGMKNRTLNCKGSDYALYMGRGITICEEWKDYVPFRDWALSNGYSDELSIDRIDNDGNYEPDNCRWTTKSIQCRNQRLRKDNTSGFRGVSFDKSASKFIVEIQVDKKRIGLGRFKTAVEGAIAYNNYITENNLEGFILNILPKEN